MGRPIKKGSTDQSTVIRIIDSSDFTPETTVEHDTSGIDLWYRREQETKTSITEAALASLDAAHSDGGIEHIADGYYRLDLPDAAVAAGSGENSVQIGGTVTGMIVIGNEHALVDYDPYDSVRAGLTALPNAAADAAGGVPISDAGGLDLDSALSGNTPQTGDNYAIVNGDHGLVSIQDDLDTLLSRVSGNVALASVLGALDDAAAAGDPTSADTLMQYVKQLINVLVGTAGVGTFPAEAAPANGVSLSEVLRAIHTDVTGLNGDAMRGTDSAALASVCTEARLAELDAGNIPADIAAVPTAAEIKTAMEASGSDLHYLVIDLLNKKTINIATGNTTQYTDAGASIGTINSAYSDDGTDVERLRMVQ